MDLTTQATEATATLQYLIDACSTDSLAKIESSVDENLNLITLIIEAPVEQLGQIIGKEGKIIKSLRTLLSLAYPGYRLNIQIKN